MRSMPRATALPNPCGPGFLTTTSSGISDRIASSFADVASTLASSTTMISCGILCSCSSTCRCFTVEMMQRSSFLAGITTDSNVRVNSVPRSFKPISSLIISGAAFRGNIRRNKERSLCQLARKLPIKLYELISSQSGFASAWVAISSSKDWIDVWGCQFHCRWA